MDSGKDGNVGQDPKKVANSAVPAPGRRADIYVGVDVFGRGCLGGGGKGDELSFFFVTKFFYQCCGSAF